MRSETKLRLVKIVHSLVWTVFAGAILGIPVFTALGQLRVSLWLIGFVLIEVATLSLNRMRCPLTDVAARYTLGRRDNFDIYLPEWLAKNNKRIFGGVFVASIVYTSLVWVSGCAAT